MNNKFRGNNTVEYLYDQDDFAEWVLEQEDYWVDREGSRHVLVEMPKEYLLNVLIFLHERHPFDYEALDHSPLVKRLRSMILE